MGSRQGGIVSRFANRLKGAVAGIFAAAPAATTRPAGDRRTPDPALPAQPLGHSGVPEVHHQLSYLTDVAELQRLELARLLDQNRRLNSRIDQLLIMQQRDHALRERLHAVLARFAEVDVAATDGRVASAEARYRALRRSVGHLVGHLARTDPAKGAAAPAIRHRPSA